MLCCLHGVCHQSYISACLCQLSPLFLLFVVICHNYLICAFTLFIITVDCFSFFVVNCHDYLVCAFTLFIIIVDCFSLFVVNCHNYSLYLLTLFTDPTVYMSHFNCHISYVSCSTVPSIYTFCLIRYMMYAVKCWTLLCVLYLLLGYTSWVNGDTPQFIDYILSLCFVVYV